ncbi:uncharacterized protein LOC126690893 [Quercus robur]|uniref:uncharacterized protein LOC126690893 n=1 Tax=Quercus robur TaxID=38942 RepID=UPI002161E0C8|nr:uncharacterized protein LOC126690893 [Quercus robur]
MAKPLASIPSFSHFAVGPSPFLQLALCSFPESSGKSGDQEEEALPQEAGTGSEPVIPEGIVRPIQVADLHPERKAASPPVSASGDTVMGDASKVAASDLDSGLSSFLTRFDLLEFNSLPASHFHIFGSSYGSFLRFSVPVEGLLLLESLLKSHGDFTSGFRGGIFLGNILELLCAVLVSLRNSSVDSLSEEKFLEWRGVVQDLLEAKFNLSFLLNHLRLLAHMLFQRQSFKSINTEIAAVEEVLAHAHKVLQDLKVKRQRILSTLTVPVISPDASLLAGLIP